jgi:hypothetical protein
MEKRGLLIVALIIGVALLVTGCYNRPVINRQLQSSGNEVLELENLVYIPAKDDSALGVAGRLLRDVDQWIKDHPQVEVKSVSFVNNTVFIVLLDTHTELSGAVIMFTRR